MILVTQELRLALRANALAADQPGHDPAPVVKLFNPVGAGIWLATELDEDGDTLFGLADLGFGCPELGSFSLSEIISVRLPFGLAIERDLCFAGRFPLSVYAEAARRASHIIEFDEQLKAAAAELARR
ncbi:single-stranded DNA endonuclease [Sphingomonas sp. DBB INV C78]|uniref:DUF2958 domain-containing protein n=1 Tax=Sphingomonas sp. DBB INV C78 TaxID=3349434 RepID=UPI0036D29D85